MRRDVRDRAETGSAAVRAALELDQILLTELETVQHLGWRLWL